MEPLTTLGLVANIIQLLDFGGKVIHEAQEIYSSASGTTELNDSLEVQFNAMKITSSKLIPVHAQPQSDEEKVLIDEAKECQRLSAEMFLILDKIRSKDPGSKRECVKAVLRSSWHKSDKEQLQGRLDHCRGQLQTQMLYMMRYVVIPSMDTIKIQGYLLEKRHNTRFGELTSRKYRFSNEVGQSN